MALTCLAKTGYAGSSRTKVGAPDPKGREVQEALRPSARRGREAWEQFGATPSRLRASLGRLLDQRDALAEGSSRPGGWRASKPYAERTRALLDDPLAALPHYPMVLHRGGWPDGS